MNGAAAAESINFLKRILPVSKEVPLTRRVMNNLLPNMVNNL